MTLSPRLLVLTAAFVSLPALSMAQTPAGTPASPPPTNAMGSAPAEATAPAASTAAPAATAPAADMSAPATEHPSSYTVAQGDSLWTIAHKFGTTVVKLRKANNLKKHALLHPGQVLQIPPAMAAK